MPETLERLPASELPELNGFAPVLPDSAPDIYIAEPDLSVPPVLPKPAPNVYKTERGLTASLLRKGTARPGRGLYPRDGTANVTDVETAISALTIPGQRNNVIVSSGMAAVTAATEFALKTRGKQLWPGRGPKLVHGIEHYSQSLAAFLDLQYMGVDVEGFDVGAKTVESLMAEKEPDVLCFETVANTPGMPVFDVHGLLAITRELPEDEAPIVVFDHTVALSTGLDFTAILTPKDKYLIAESATKGGMHNSDHLGVVYSKHEELMDDFRKYKATHGVVTSTHADIAYLRAIQATTPGYHERNRALYASTGKLAVAMSQAQRELGSDPEFTVSFPTFEDHPHHAYAKKHFLHGVAPVVFMACNGFDPAQARQLLQRIAKHPKMKEQINEGQIFMGQSFGFKEARLLYDRHAPYIRVAGGYDIDSDALAEALFEAAVDA